MSSELLKEAIALSKSGKKNDAQKILKQIIKNDPNNETAWLWFVDTFPTKAERIKAFKLMLKYNPDSRVAKKGLNLLELNSAQEESGITKRKTQPKPVSKIGFVIFFIIVAIGVYFLLRVPSVRMMIPNSPESIAVRFLRLEASYKDFSPDTIYDWYDFIWVWRHCWAKQTNCRWDINFIVMRNGIRAGTKEVTIQYTRTGSDNVENPNKGLRVYEDVISQTHDPSHFDGWVFVVVEKQNGRWVVKCAEGERETPNFPDLCVK